MLLLFTKFQLEAGFGSGDRRGISSASESHAPRCDQTPALTVSCVRETACPQLSVLGVIAAGWVVSLWGEAASHTCPALKRCPQCCSGSSGPWFWARCKKKKGGGQISSQCRLAACIPAEDKLNEMCRIHLQDVKPPWGSFRSNSATGPRGK